MVADLLGDLGTTSDFRFFVPRGERARISRPSKAFWPFWGHFPRKNLGKASSPTTSNGRQVPPASAFPLSLKIPFAQNSRPSIFVGFFRVFQIPVFEVFRSYLQNYLRFPRNDFQLHINAAVAEQVDARDLKSRSVPGVPVRVRSAAPPTGRSFTGLPVFLRCVVLFSAKNACNHICGNLFGFAVQV